ncbi:MULTISPECIES: phosphotransferase [unclassified Actinobaculum]|uniref:phosphotransferase n=1 Tax=unclassified Actinobaculum TaxID=2609299 RepID=UPI000D525953|nr:MULTISPECIES: phosphotransferase [unclassified Actinobaculum]AWE42155.1 phosphotransferase [Actinobaculum sp. 313]RTE50717.1 phosphotransferase [Actinobaculum sp. 352]
MNTSPLYLAALAVSAIDGLEAVGTRPPFTESEDFVTGGVLDARGQHWVVKYPKNSLAATILEAEASLAPILLEELRAGRLSFDIMRPAGFADGAADGRAIVYPEPFGHSNEFELMNDAQARELGRTLAAIHSLSTDVIARAGLPVYSVEEWRQRLRVELHDAAQTSSIPAVLRRRWENALEDDALWQYEPVVVHGDVAAENFLWSNGTTVSSVLGFGEARVGDPAQDLAPLLGLGDEPFDLIVESYQNTRGVRVDDAMYSRTLLMSELAVIRWLMYGIRTSNNSVRTDAETMLLDLAEQINADPDLVIGPSWNVDPQANNAP